MLFYHVEIIIKRDMIDKFMKIGDHENLITFGKYFQVPYHQLIFLECQLSLGIKLKWIYCMISFIAFTLFLLPLERRLLKWLHSLRTSNNFILYLNIAGELFFIFFRASDKETLVYTTKSSMYMQERVQNIQVNSLRV